MSELSPREKLATVLAHIGADRGRNNARKAGVSVIQFANAVMGRPTTTVAYLRICVAYRIDPLPELPHPNVTIPTDFDHCLLAIGFRLRRHMNKHTVRDVAKLINVSPVTVFRVENGHAMSIGVVLRVCRYLDQHPFAFLRVSIVSRETPTETRRVA